MRDFTDCKTGADAHNKIEVLHILENRDVAAEYNKFVDYCIQRIAEKMRMPARAAEREFWQYGTTRI